jgi:hypothetical protein
MRKLSIPLIILGVLLTYNSCCALSEGYRSSIIGEVNFLLNRHPHVVYKWDTQGGIHVYDQNWGDCSSTLFAIVKRVGLPVYRVAAIDMESGRGGWKNKPVKLEDAEEATMVWWSWSNPETGKKPKRIHGHVGLLAISPKSKLLEVVHNSSSRGFHIEPLRGVLIDDLSSIKNLTHGDKVEVKLGPGVVQTTKPEVKK